MKPDHNVERDWLGIEAIPGGLMEIIDTIEGRADATARKRPLSYQQHRPAGLIAFVGRWMKRASRLN